MRIYRAEVDVRGKQTYDGEKNMKKTKANQVKLTMKVQKKIKRLKKVKVWPSIIFFVLSLLITVASVVTIVFLFISYMFQEKFDSALQSTKYIESMIENSLVKNETYEEAMAFLQEDNSFNNAVAILDSDYTLLAQYGTMSYDLTREGSLELLEQYRFYLDRESSGEIFDKDGKLMPNLQQLFQRCFREYKSEDSEWLNTEVCNEPYWLMMPDNTRNLRIMVRNDLSLTCKDIIYICGIGAGILVVMCILLLFLFFHVLSGVFRQRRMYRLLSMDSLTGGYNWFYFSNRADKILNKSWNADKLYAVIHLTYGKYRSYCSCYGGQAGEALLQQLDQFLVSHLRKGELCAHTLEAEYALLIRCDTREEAGSRIKAWFDEILTMIPQCHVSFHAGICMVDILDKGDKTKKTKHREADTSQLYHNASIASDAIAESEEKGVLFFDDNMRAQQLWEHHVEENMEKALAAEEFKVYLQPKYNPVTEELSGAEALVRWINQEDGIISPGRFIPIFENDGFITRLDDYMIAHVAALQMRWLSEGRKVVPVSVNVSRAHFTRKDLAEHICQLVDQYHLPHALLEIELTESAFFDDKETLLQTVNSLKEYGFCVSMDDFGAGYSSLNSLKELPLDVLKLDAEFFRGRYEKERGNIVVSEAISLAKNLNMKIVAEGIEEQDQVTFLAGLGCDMIQGYYFAKPMPANEYEAKMK